LKKLTAKRLEVNACWVGPGPVTPQRPSRPRKKLTKGKRRSINVGEGVRRFCSWIRGT
jgi:hypothetical protein